MKKILFFLLTAACTVALQAKVVTFTLDNGEKRYFSSSQLGSIDINENQSTVTTWDGEVIDELTNCVRNVQINDDPVIYEEKDMTWRFSYDKVAVSELNLDITLTDYDAFKRDVRVLRYLYPSVDPTGDPVTLSGIIVIPKNILDGDAQSDGILLFNHFTIANYREAPSEDYNYLEAMFIANPLAINYIIVESDFYGFGTSVRFPQAYLYGQTNAKASLDGLAAAKVLLENMGINYGKYLFNVGYSSGGFDALAVQKEVDNNHRGEIKIDKTFAGGSPSDLTTVYKDYVNTDAITYLVSVPLMLVSYNESGSMGLDYDDVFKPLIADHIDEWILSKEYSTQPINDMIGREHTVSDMLQPAYTDINSPESQYVIERMDAMSLATDWNVDPNDNIFLFHSRDDDYVTFQSARSFADFLTANGFEKSIIPGRTNLHTNLVVKKMGHLTATLVYLVQSVASLKAWPLIHATPETEAAYQALVSAELDIVGILDTFKQLGIDVRKLVPLLEEQGIPLNKDLIPLYLQQLGIDANELNEMCEDSGIDLMETLEALITYLKTEDPEQNHAEMLQAPLRIQDIKDPVKRYEMEFKQWLKLE